MQLTNDRPSDALIAQQVDRQTRHGGCCGQNSAGVVRPLAPWPEHRPEGVEALIDWITRKVMNGAQRFRNFAYKVRTWRHACRLGRIGYHSYHLRRLHCDDCAYRPDDPITESCRADQCHCRSRKGELPKRAALESKLKLSGWKCPAGLFGVRNFVGDPRQIERDTNGKR